MLWDCEDDESQLTIYERFACSKPPKQPQGHKPLNLPFTWADTEFDDEVES